MRVSTAILAPLTLAAGLALGMGGGARAAVLNWEGTQTLVMWEFPRADFYGGGLATVNGSSGVIPAHLETLRLVESRGVLGGSLTQFITDPEAPQGVGVYAAVFDDIRISSGSVARLSGGAASTSIGGGTLPLRGVVKLCLLSTACTTYASLDLQQPTTVNGLPGTGIKGVGVGGLVTLGGYGGIRVSVQAAPWTIKTATVLDQITMNKWLPNQTRTWSMWIAKGWAHAPASTTTSTAQPGGMLQLVTPGQVETNIAFGSFEKIGSFAILAIRFIPEPGLFLLLGSGVAGLALLGRRRIRGQPR